MESYHPTKYPIRKRKGEKTKFVKITYTNYNKPDRIGDILLRRG